MQAEPNEAQIRGLRSASVNIELVSPARYAASPSGPWKFERLIGAGVHEAVVGETLEDLIYLKEWLTRREDVVLGWFNYDLKNLLETLTTSFPERIPFPLFYFFVPEHVAIERDGKWQGFGHSSFPNGWNGPKVEPRLGEVCTALSEDAYLDKVKRILGHIQQGDIYETNFCAEHFATDAVIDPLVVFENMVSDGEAPFACRVAYNKRHLLCGSPERFMTKTGRRVISQPMKGTNRREAENEVAKCALANDAKERTENIMITDMVRNDLSKCAEPGSVHVDELCAVYPYAHVNQMISTVSCSMREGVHPLDILLGAFPMGSMTGAPKVRAMQLMDDIEGFGRGLYSGSVGYFTPELDFDFNVVIRSILYDEAAGNLSFPTGGAITVSSDPGKEFDECMLKAESMKRILKQYAG